MQNLLADNVILGIGTHTRGVTCGTINVIQQPGIEIKAFDFFGRRRAPPPGRRSKKVPHILDSWPSLWVRIPALLYHVPHRILEPKYSPVRRSWWPLPGYDVEKDKVVRIKVPEWWTVCEDLENLQPVRSDMITTPTS